MQYIKNLFIDQLCSDVIHTIWITITVIRMLYYSHLNNIDWIADTMLLFAFTQLCVNSNNNAAQNIISLFTFIILAQPCYLSSTSPSLSAAIICRCLLPTSLGKYITHIKKTCLSLLSPHWSKLWAPHLLKEKYIVTLQASTHIRRYPLTRVGNT